MTPRECFGVVIRTVGLALLVSGSYEILSSIYVYFTPERHHSASPAVYIAYGALFILVSLYFLRGAPALLRFCYPGRLGQEQDQGAA